MGVDLVAVSSADGIEKWHENWRSWRAIRVLLRELGQDVEAMSNENDGALLPAATASAWGHAIQAAIEADRILVATYPDENYVGGIRKNILVKDTPTLAFPATQEPTSVVSLDQDSDFDAWLREFAAFCSGSGGLLQY